MRVQPGSRFVSFRWWVGCVGWGGYGFLKLLRNLKGYALCRRPPLSGRGLCGGGYVVLAGFTGCWLFWVLWFPVKCAEASWLLEVGFYCFSSYSCHFGREFCYFGCPKPIIWYACWLHFTTLGPFCQLGDTLGDHGSSRKDTWESETRFLLISG